MSEFSYGIYKMDELRSRMDANARAGQSDTFDLDKLMAMKRLVAGIPPMPVFASCSLLPPDRALCFTYQGRQHVGAHPTMWAKVPTAERTCVYTHALRGLGEIEIIDLDVSENRTQLENFFAALAGATAGNLA